METIVGDTHESSSCVSDEPVEEAEPKKRCCSSLRFDGAKIAQGYSILGTGRGALIMSNIFLATAFTYLASEQVGCVYEHEEGYMAIAEDCDGKVFGLFRPASLITNIAVVGGLVSALFMPVIGALIDYTPHRWKIGVASAMLLILIQIIQIGITSSTWFAMALLQCLSGFLFQVQNLATYAYVPNLARAVGEEAMTKYMPTFTMIQFSSQGAFLIIVAVVAIAVGFTDVETARMSQAFNAVTVSISFYFGWRLLPSVVPPKHTLPEDKWLLTQGFIQNWNTAKEINREYKKGLRWFLLSVVFGEAAAAAFTVVSVVFLNEQLGLSGSEVGIFFFLALMGMIPGGVLAQFVATRTNPKISWCLSMLALFVIASAGALTLNTDNAMPFSYVWGFGVGILLGWYYPTVGMILSMCTPASKEGEVSGFFVYCTQILAWVPPLIFSLLVEADVDQGIGVVCAGSFFLVATGVMSMSASWKEILEEVVENDTKQLEIDNSMHTKDTGVRSSIELCESGDALDKTCKQRLKVVTLCSGTAAMTPAPPKLDLQLPP